MTCSYHLCPISYPHSLEIDTLEGPEGFRFVVELEHISTQAIAFLIPQEEEPVEDQGAWQDCQARLYYFPH